MKEKVTIKGCAKINLGLDVVGKLGNGYHLLRSVMQQIDICDIVEISGNPLIKPAADLENLPRDSQIILTSDSSIVPLDQSNLAYKAAKALIRQDKIKEGIHIHVIKRIPVAAGLAGGSTDAAAVLLGMNELLELGHSKEELCELGVKLGADVPFCIMGGTALAEGIGERLTPIHNMPEMSVVIVKPPIDVSTKYVFEHLDMKQARHPDTDGILAAMAQKDIQKMAGLLGNVLESVTVEKYPVIREIKEAVCEAGAATALMSGSGPTVFGIFETMEDAEKAEDILQRKYPQAFVRAAGII